jgi:hypothetical protein
MHGAIAPFPHMFLSTRITSPLGNQSLIPGRGQEISFSVASRLVMATMQPIIQWLQGALSSGIKMTKA